MELGQKQPDGATLRQHLLRLRENTGRRDDRLDVRIPPEGRPLWDVFAQLSASRPSGGFGPSPIGPSDMQAWCTLRGVQLTPWEADTLSAMDAALIAAAAKFTGTGASA